MTALRPPNRRLERTSAPSKAFLRFAAQALISVSLGPDIDIKKRQAVPDLLKKREKLVGKLQLFQLEIDRTQYEFKRRRIEL
jgi:hypothetical protein